jgi:Ser-tRNA(Ala) deacylase AlaX
MKIDWDQRYLHMRLHSGGHMIDHAIQFLECPFRALKASHFPSGPAVEFQVLDTVAFPTDRPSLDKFLATLQSKCDELLTKDMPVLVFEEGAPGEFSSAVAATHEQKAAEVQASKMRMVLFEGCPAAVPCGGTHVARVGEIGRVLIKKVSYKDAILRISYRLDLA